MQREILFSHTIDFTYLFVHWLFTRTNTYKAGDTTKLVMKVYQPVRVDQDKKISWHLFSFLEEDWINGLSNNLNTC